MKKILYFFIINFISIGFFNAQIVNNLDWQNMDASQRKELIVKMTPEEKTALLKTLREDFLMSDINIEESNKEEFRRIYQEYEQEQKAIKSRFNSDFDPDKLTKEEAEKKLEESFLVGQQLLDSRKKFSQKIKNILPPQDILKFYQNEGKVRDKMLERRFNNGGERPNNNSNNNAGFRNRPQNPGPDRTNFPTDGQNHPQERTQTPSARSNTGFRNNGNLQNNQSNPPRSNPSTERSNSGSFNRR